MTLFAILVLAALAILLPLLRAVRGQSVAVRQVDDLSPHLRPVDVEAFRNLVDPAEEVYLRRHLPPREFRKIQRERFWAATEYVSAAAHNAAILLRLGEAARRSPDPQIAQAAQQLVDCAVRLRLYAFLVQAKLYVGILLPGSRFSPTGIADTYQQLNGLLIHLGRLQYPSRGARISAAL